MSAVILDPRDPLADLFAQAIARAGADKEAKEAKIEQLMRRIAANLGLDLDAWPWTPEADDPAIDEDGDAH